MDEIRPMVGVLMLRLGRNFDGGYVVPQLALKECDVLISLGYGYDSSFEREFLKLNRKKSVDLYDSNINIQSSVERLFLDLRSVIFRGRGFPVFRSKQLLEYLVVLFNQRINCKVGKIGHINDSKCLNLVDTLKASAYKKIILKMDIEGAEMDALLGSIKMLSERSIDMILLEVEPYRLEAFKHTGLEIYDFLSNLGYTAFCSILNDKIFKITDKNISD